MIGSSPKSCSLSSEYVIDNVLPSEITSLMVTLTPLLSSSYSIQSKTLYNFHITLFYHYLKIGICHLLLVILQRMSEIRCQAWQTDTPTKIDAAATPFFQLFIFFFVRIDCFTLRFYFFFSISEASISSSSFLIYINIILIVHKCLSYDTTSKTNFRSICCSFFFPRYT